MLTELGVRDGPSLCLSLVPVDLPFDCFPDGWFEGFARGVAYCEVLGCPLVCSLWCALGAWLLLRVWFSV